MSALILPFRLVSPIPILTLWEPWASLIVAGFKLHETRHWHTKRRGPVAIHAARKVVLDVDPELEALCDFALGADWRKTRPLGCVVSIATLSGCFRSDHLAEGRLPLLSPVEDCDHIAGNYEVGRFGFRLDHSCALADPLLLKSRQTPFWAWTPPEDLATRLLPPVDHMAAAMLWQDHRRAAA